ncbi:hypothetical protein [Stratiformator vulcanicus]|uniref:Carbohydrate-binding domain-containing protein n=1 Tax=Stratiformator vulcanicus TaxID=2527980 RepID=A0A517R1Z4_9PLAN|nr:hypothetical protein [Stratiformator vulcanicus]QDT37906.1 hypothetical protein Pan189_22890 [Stratiformator vulcanicus]
MSTAPDALPVPASFLFSPVVNAVRADALPGKKPGLCPLPAAARLPFLGSVDEEPKIADCFIGWNERGFGLRFLFDNTPALKKGAERQITLWFDGRPDGKSRRAGRFCRQLQLTFTGGSAKVSTEEIAIDQNRESPTAFDPSSVRAEISKLKAGDRIDIWLDAEAIPGFDPESSPRLGFTYLIDDPLAGRQTPAAGPEFPIDRDPTLWLLLRLTDEI